MHFFVAKLLSVAVLTYIYVRHVRNVRPMNRLIHHSYSEQTSATVCQDSRDSSACVNACHCVTPLSFGAYFLRNPREYQIQFYTPETRVPELHVLLIP